jgi:uncharacterized protein DUF397
MEINSVKWHKSTRCGSNACVEVAKVNDEYLVRDSKNPEVAPLSFTGDEWTAFVEGVAAGEFRF